MKDYREATIQVSLHMNKDFFTKIAFLHIGLLHLLLERMLKHSYHPGVLTRKDEADGVQPQCMPSTWHSRVEN